MSEVVEVQVDALPCPVCPEELGITTLVEPEVDGGYSFYECDECGYGWGYRKVDESTRVEGNCAIGVPEEVRRRSSAPMEAALAAQTPTTVDLGLTIGRRPHEHSHP